MPPRPIAATAPGTGRRRVSVMAMLAAALPALAACALTTTAAPPPLASPSAPAPSSPTPLPVRLRPPADAVLLDSEAGLDRSGGQDHLSAARWAASQPDPVAAGSLATGAGWVDMTTRTWALGGRVASDQVLLTLTPGGAVEVYGYWAAGTERDGLIPSACPPAVLGLGQCRVGTAGDRWLAVGQRATLVFRLEGSGGASLDRLLPAQAARLPVPIAGG